MYGKHYSSMYTGSMVGAGGTAFALMGYCISNADPRTHIVELNPNLMSAIIGDPIEKIKDAIMFLCEPDPNSRNKDADGRRLVYEGAFRYYVVSHDHYRKLFEKEAKAGYNRNYMRDYRKEKALVDDINNAESDAKAIKSAVALVRLSHDDFKTVPDDAIINTLKDTDRSKWVNAIKTMSTHYAGVSLGKPCGRLANYLAGKIKPKNSKKGGYAFEQE